MGDGWLLITMPGETGQPARRGLERLRAHRNGLHLTYPQDRIDLGTWLTRADVRSALRLTKYILIAGELPIEVMGSLKESHQVGVINFDGLYDDVSAVEAAYSMYAKRVVEWVSPKAVPRLLGFVPNYDGFTQRAHDLIWEPLLDSDEKPEGGEVACLHHSEATAERLSALLLDGTNDLFLALCHGEETLQADGQWLEGHSQGALLGFLGLPIPGAKTFGVNPKLKGGIGILYACNSGMTPRRRRSIVLNSLLFAPSKDVWSLDAQLWMANPDGPRALLAHNDKVFLKSLPETEGHSTTHQSDAGAIVAQQLVLDLWHGVSVGQALKGAQRLSWHAYQYILDDHLRTHQNSRQGFVGDPATDSQQLAGLFKWFRLIDSEGWMILGDPQVSLS